MPSWLWISNVNLSSDKYKVFPPQQVEVALCGMVDALVNDSAGKSIAILVLIVVSREESASYKP